jgi:hypothetical protein
MTIDMSSDTKLVPISPWRFCEQSQSVLRLPQIQAGVRTAQKNTTLRV